MLGAGIRLGEAIATWEPGLEPQGGQKLSDRLGALEDRLQSLETEGRSANASQLDAHAEAVAAVGSQIRAENQTIEALSRAGALSETALRGELRDWLEESVATRMAEAESRLKAETERGQKQMLDAFVESVQTRVIHRISQLEEEVAGQSAAMNDLRECSLRTERSIQKLLGGLDKLIVKQPAEEGPVSNARQDANPKPPELPGTEDRARNAEPSPQPSPPEPLPTLTAPRPRSRWHIFG